MICRRPPSRRRRSVRSKAMEPLDPLVIAELKAAVVTELESRRFADAPGCYADERGGGEYIYGLTAAAFIHASLNLPLGSRENRAAWAGRILEHADAQGHFTSHSGPGHAVHMVVGALNVLGEPMPQKIGPLAPQTPKELVAWLEGLDWNSTHKELGGQTIPLLAGGHVAAGWADMLYDSISRRLDPASPKATWCKPNAPPWRVVSCVYHVLALFDQGARPYPQPQMLLDRLLDLKWEDVPGTVGRTACTDGDWAWVLLHLRDQLPQHGERIMAAIRKVSARRVRQWHGDRQSILSQTTHDIYCYLWSSAVFQSCVRDHYRGAPLTDTLNNPTLFRL